MDPMELLMVFAALLVSLSAAFALQRALLGALLGAMQHAIDPNHQHKTATR
jgi:hypothetical protein